MTHISLAVLRLTSEAEYFSTEGGGISLGDISLVADDPQAYRALARAASMAAVQMEARRLGMPEPGQRFEFGGKRGVVDRIDGNLILCTFDDDTDMAFGAEAFAKCKREQGVMAL